MPREQEQFGLSRTTRWSLLLFFIVSGIASILNSNFIMLFAASALAGSVRTSRSGLTASVSPLLLSTSVLFAAPAISGAVVKADARANDDFQEILDRARDIEGRDLAARENVRPSMKLLKHFSMPQGDLSRDLIDGFCEAMYFPLFTIFPRLSSTIDLTPVEKMARCLADLENCQTHTLYSKRGDRFNWLATATGECLADFKMYITNSELKYLHSARRIIGDVITVLGEGDLFPDRRHSSSVFRIAGLLETAKLLFQAKSEIEFYYAIEMQSVTHFDELCSLLSKTTRTLLKWAGLGSCTSGKKRKSYPHVHTFVAPPAIEVTCDPAFDLTSHQRSFEALRDDVLGVSGSRFAMLGLIIDSHARMNKSLTPKDIHRLYNSIVNEEITATQLVCDVFELDCINGEFSFT